MNYLQIKYFFIFSISLFVLFPACNNHRIENRQINPEKYRDALININKKMVDEEDNLINQYIRHEKLTMEQTGTGLRYCILYHGKGTKASKGKIAVISYTIRLLNGDLCYSSEKEGFKEFEIGRGGVESGLEEGILLLNVGDQAKFILPSHLAYGLIGDNNKIPAKASIVYDITLEDLKGKP